MKLENKVKTFKVLANVLKYGGIFLCAAAIPTLIVLVASGVLMATALIPAFAMFVFGGTALSVTHIAEVYRDGYKAELKQRNHEIDQSIKYETEHTYNLTTEEEKEIITNTNPEVYTEKTYTDKDDNSKDL